MIAPDALASTALAAVLDAPTLDAAHAAARAGLDRIGAGSLHFAPFKIALHELHVSEATLYRRVRAGAGELVNGKWIVNVDAAKAMGRRRHE